MSDRLPESIDPIQLADKQGIVKGCAPICKMVRLRELLSTDAGSIAVELNFRREGRLAFIEGQIEGVISPTCQNCLDAIEWPIKHALKLGIVTSIEQAARLPEDYEPLLLADEKILVNDLIEDELLLLLPTYPKHSQACVIGGQVATPSDRDIQGATPKRENPFSILAKLKIPETTHGSSKK